MSIVTIVKNIAQAIVIDGLNMSFCHGDKSWQNLISDNVQLPATYLDEPITSKDSYKKGGFLQTGYPISLVFAGLSRMDWTPDQHQEVIDKMRLASVEFINRCSIDPNIKSVGQDIGRTDVTNLFDVNVTGVIMTITLEPFNNAGICIP